jgi:hypothetical protein
MFEKITSFIWENRFVIVVIITIIVQAISTWRETKSKLYTMMLGAKSKAKDQILSSGKEQEEWVIRIALQKLPWLVNVIGEDLTRKLIKLLYDKGKDWMDDGKINNSR